jgi:voltage-gated potassium channel
MELQRAKKTFVVIDRNEARVERAMRAGMLAVVADATRDDCLREVGVLSANGLIAALPGDAENLFIILSAKTLNPKLTVVTRASEEEAGEKLRRAGADTVFAPYTMAGQRLAHALVRPHVVEFFDFASNSVGPRIMTEQVWVAPDSTAAGKPLSATLATGESGVIVLAIRRANGDMVFNPPAATQISGGDYLIVLGEQLQLQKLEKLLTRDADI